MFSSLHVQPAKNSCRILAQKGIDRGQSNHTVGMSNSITFSDVSFSRSGKRVLGPLDLSLTEDRIGIVGCNGSGKSTLLRLACGLLEPESGRVEVAGKDIFADRTVALTEVGIIFQNPDHQIIFPTIVEEVAFGLQQQGLSKNHARDKALAFLTAHGRGHWADRSTSALSQGQRHYLCLLSVLAMEPNTLFLDEPYAGLDIPTSARLHRELDGLDQQIVLVTHDPRVLSGFDRVIWLDKGQVAGDGDAATVLAAFNAEMTRLGGLDAGADLTA
jgi:biotin transport system ATP-binding protein